MSSTPANPTCKICVHYLNGVDAVAASGLLREPQAWCFVLQWAGDKIQFPRLVELMTSNFGDQYIPAEWQGLFNRVFHFSDPGEDIEDSDRVPMAIAAVKGAMSSLGVAIVSPGSSAARPSPPNAKGGGKRKATVLRRSRPRKRTCTSAVNKFLDIEAQVDTDEQSEEEGEEEGSEQFIVADDVEDAQPRHPIIPLTRVYPLTNHAGPSTFQAAVNKISNRFIPSSLDNIDDAEYDQLHDDHYGISQNGDEREGPYDSDMEVLDGPGVWGAIQEWLYGTLNYPTLLEMIDFQYDHNPKIQYWEEFMSQLAFIENLDERKSLFSSISLADHLVRIANYRPPTNLLSDSSPPSPPFVSGPLQAKEYVKTFIVSVVPRSSVDYIVNAWKNASIQSAAHKLLPGRVTVHAPYPNAFLHAVPQSHRSCIRGWSLVPVEDQAWHSPSKGSNPSVPGWYSISKRGIYKGDIGHAISFDSESGELHVLVVPRRLKWRNLPTRHNRNARTLFSPNIHHGRLDPPCRSLPRYRHLAEVFISGLLLLKLKAHQFSPIPTPSPSQITLHVASMADPHFMNVTHEKYNRLFWKRGDHVTISDSSVGDTWGTLVSIDTENEFAVVCLHDLDGPEYDLPLNSLRRLHRVGDVVRVLPDSSSDPLYVHHQNLGRSGMICEVDPLVDEITVQASDSSQFRVPGFLLESHRPDQSIYAPFGALVPLTDENSEDEVQIGDMVELRDEWAGEPTYNRGFVIEVQRTDATLTFLSTEKRFSGQQFHVPITAVHVTLDHCALKFTPERGYNVKTGDFVFVIRGDHRGASGTVSQVSLEEKSLAILCQSNSQVSITVPIVHCAHTYTVDGVDECKAHRDKEVLIISGPNKGWRGFLVSCGPATCVVSRHGGTHETYKKDQVVVRGLASTLAGRLLTPYEVLQVFNAFERATVPLTSERARTRTPSPEPQPAASPGPWTVDERDREDLMISRSRPKLNVHDFILHPNVTESLKTVRAVFRISPGWRDTYIDRLAKTEVPSPFKTPSGPVPTGHLACRLTAQTKGADIMQVTIPETSLSVYRPVKKNTLCMVILREVEGGEPIGSLLSVVKAAEKQQRVTVRRLDGALACESYLPLDRVIVVEAP